MSGYIIPEFNSSNTRRSELREAITNRPNDWSPLILAMSLTHIGVARARIEEQLDWMTACDRQVELDDVRALLLRVEERICQRF